VVRLAIVRLHDLGSLCRRRLGDAELVRQRVAGVTETDVGQRVARCPVRIGPVLPAQPQRQRDVLRGGQLRTTCTSGNVPVRW